jgi:hypothetical protein
MGTPAQTGASFFEQLTRAQLTEWWVSLALLAVGTSLLLRPKMWINAMGGAVAHPLTPLLSGLYATLVGLGVVLTHNIWVTDTRVVVTILGWVALTAGVLMMVVPEVYSVMLRRIPLSPQLVALRGLIRIALGGVLVGYLLSQG